MKSELTSELVNIRIRESTGYQFAPPTSKDIFRRPEYLIVIHKMQVTTFDKFTLHK
ncbi:hypothetical protein K0M31_014361, partial [Melipona bicolor]